MLGYKPDEFENSYDSYKSLIHPDDLNRVEEQTQSYLDGIVSEYSIAFRMRHNSGQWGWVNARGKAVYDKNGKPQRMVGAHMDINHIKAYEEKLKEAKEKAEAANQAKTDFLAHMSHEIRTPLTAISGIAEILEKNIHIFEPRQQKLVKTLRSSTESLTDLVNDILDFSKIESGQVDLEKESFALEKLFDQVISIVTVKANEKGLDFNFDFDAVRKIQFIGDKVRIRQILINLIGNAVKFTESGYVHVKAYEVKWQSNSGLRIDIEDTGIGIAQENMELIFDRFKQADSSVSRKFGGSGLGLPISLSLARLMKGDILVNSELGAGSTFSLIIPLHESVSEREALKDKEIMSQNKKKKERQTVDENNKVLLVEDYEGNVVMLSYILESMECVFDIARTGVEALNYYKKGHYDLILMDIQMPEMDGLTAAREIRKYEAENKRMQTPIIGMTAHATAGDKDKCLEAGMNAYLPKPIIEADLEFQILKFLKETQKAA